MKYYTVIVLLMMACGPLCRNGFTSEKPLDRVKGKIVSIEKYRDHYKVIIDNTRWLKYHRRYIGKEYAELIMKVFPRYQVITDSYLKDICYGNRKIYKTLLMRSALVRKKVPLSYYDEIYGMKYVFNAPDKMGDGRLSLNEMFVLNLLTDVGRATACSGLSVWGASSKKNTTVTGRNLEWYPGSRGQLYFLNAVTVIKYKQKRSVCLVGYLGLLSAITGFNDRGVFAAILDSPVGGPPVSCINKNSYVMDIRYALETSTTGKEAAAILVNNGRQYAYNHLVLVSDRQGACVVENNISRNKRLIRHARSPLHDGVDWEHDESVCVVNAFLSKGTYNNFSGSPFNYKRFNTYKQLTAAYIKDGISIDELQTCLTYEKGPDAYCHIYKGSRWKKLSVTLQSCVFAADTMDLYVYFKTVKNKHIKPSFSLIKNVF